MFYKPGQQMGIKDHKKKLMNEGLTRNGSLWPHTDMKNIQPSRDSRLKHVVIKSKDAAKQFCAKKVRFRPWLI
jgi:hypothetical protein